MTFWLSMLLFLLTLFCYRRELYDSARNWED